MQKWKLLVNKKFGKLTVLRYLRKEGKNRIWECQCDCGNIIECKEYNFRYGHKTSCGCAFYQYNKGKDSYLWKGYGELSARRWHTIRSNAKKRNIAFDLTIEEAWNKFEQQKRTCALTGIILDFPPKTNCIGDWSASIDRITNSLGYNINNIWWIHKEINWMKWDLDLERFFQLCFLVINPIPKHDNTSCNEIPQSLFRQYERGAIKRQLVFAIDKSFCNLLIKKQHAQCAITGLPIGFESYKNYSASLDRINSEVGYIPENVQWVHKDINRALKRELNLEELYKWCRLIIEFNHLDRNPKIVDFRNQLLHNCRKCPLYTI